SGWHAPRRHRRSRRASDGANARPRDAGVRPAMSQLEVRREHQGTVAIVSFHGEFDYAEMGIAQEAIGAAEAQEPTTLVLELTGVEFMAASAVGVALRADSRAGANGRPLALVPGTGPPQRVLSILGLTDRLDVVASRDAVLHP